MSVYSYNSFIHKFIKEFTSIFVNIRHDYFSVKIDFVYYTRIRCPMIFFLYIHSNIYPIISLFLPTSLFLCLSLSDRLFLPLSVLLSTYWHIWLNLPDLASRCFMNHRCFCSSICWSDEKVCSSDQSLNFLIGLGITGSRRILPKQIFKFKLP